MSEKDETLPIFAPRSEFTAEMSNSLFFNRALPYQFLQRKSKKFIFLTVSSLIIIFLLVEYVSGFYNYV